MTVDMTIKLLIYTWFADGKTEEQVSAICRAAGLPAEEAEMAIAAFRSIRARPEDVCAVREQTGCSMNDAKRSVVMACGDVTEAVRMMIRLGRA